MTERTLADVFLTEEEETDFLRLLRLVKYHTGTSGLAAVRALALGFIVDGAPPVEDDGRDVNG